MVMAMDEGSGRFMVAAVLGPEQEEMALFLGRLLGAVQRRGAPVELVVTGGTMGQSLRHANLGDGPLETAREEAKDPCSTQDEDAATFLVNLAEDMGVDTFQALHSMGFWKRVALGVDDGLSLLLVRHP